MTWPRTGRQKYSLCDRSSWQIMSAKRRWWKHSKSPLKQPKNVRNPWITCCCTDLRGWEKLPWLILLPTRWADTLRSPPARPWKRGGDLIGILTHLEEGDVLFVDEVHRVPKIVEEFLYPAMEDFAVDFVFDKGIHARSHRYRLKPFTLVGATTRVGLISAPLRDRFGIFRNLDFYEEHDLAKIVRRSAALLNVEVNAEGAKELARRSRGTPRIVNRLLKRVRDFTQVRGDGRITLSTVQAALDLEGVDDKGLTKLDRQYLETIINYYKGGPVGIEAIAATLQEETDTLVDVVEPYLLKMGLITRTPSGRKASPSTYQHLKRDPLF